MVRKLLIAAACLLTFTPAAGAAQPGVNLAGVPTGADLDAAAGLGAKTARIFVLWADIEHTQGQHHDVQAYANIARGLADRGMKAVFVVTTSPAWASATGDTSSPPANPADYAAFLSWFANRPGIKGNVAGYEIWNEQDEDHFWHQPPGAARATTYSALVNAAGPAVHAADPAAKVILGPFTGNNYVFLEQLYGAGLNKGAYDVLAVHTDTACLDRGPYDYYRDNGKLARYTFLGYREVHNTAVANGDDKPIWMTELGWSTVGGLCERGVWAGQKPAGVTEAAQAKHLREAFSCLAETPYVEVAQWFTLRDLPGAPVEELRHYGLYRADGSAKPSLQAFKDVAGAPGADVLDEPCGDFAGPKLRIVTPAPGTQFVDKLDVKAAATDSGVGIARISFAYDADQEIRNFTAGLDEDEAVGLAPWHGSSNLGLGKHTVIVSAVDKAGNVTRQTVEVEKVKTLKSTLTPKVTLGRKALRCKGRTCTLRGSLARGVAGSPSLGGKVAVEWQFRNKKGKWKKLVGGLKPANKPFTFKAKLKFAGRWRVRAVYRGQAPWKPVKSRWVTFRVR